MDSRSAADFAVLLSVLALPVACSGDDGAGSDTSSGGTTESATTGSGGETSAADTTTADAGSTDDGGSTSAMSSSEGEATSGTEDSTSGDNTGSSGDSTTGNAGPLCQAYGTKMAECFPDVIDANEAAQDCESTLESYASYGEDCVTALEDLYTCQSEATCRELDGGDPCFAEAGMVESNC